ncbi:hypothetical protein [Luteimonas fraxinea]|uniref:Lar family restriction alleviation protein n=1 Tax=Luteimonas fraxinea TaxID=2901869 RepID=A0ABS8UBB9_9GAMM|nr:hypothetical protein [Luteimonas fraxinea]MCD9096155.1 hypothetical protein [Luteimonas fraxinea]
MTARSTSTHRMCPACDGAGEITCNDSHDRDPQRDYEVTCTADGCVDGWIRCVPIDPIEELAFARRWARVPGYHAMHYGEIRARVVSDVPLPADPTPETHAWPQAA